MGYDAGELDARIIQAIEEFEGVPNPFALGKAIGVAGNTVTMRIEENPAINEKMEELGKKWLEGLDEKEFLEMHSQKGWVTNLPEYAKEKVVERFDGIILREVEKFEGVPTAEALGRAVGVAGHTVTTRVEENPAINEKMEELGKKWLEGLGEKEFLEMYSQKGWASNLPEYAKEKVADRLDGIILREVEKFEGVPSAFALGTAIGVGNMTISGRIEANPAINEKMEERGKKWLEGLDEKEFLEVYSQRGWTSSLPEYAKEKIADRFDGIILREVEKFEGVPTARALGKAIGVSDNTISRRIEVNPAINEKMEERGKKWLDGLGEKEFLEMCSWGGWMGTLPEYAKEKVADRLDGIILREVEKFEGVPTVFALGTAIGIGFTTIPGRVEENLAINEKMEERGKKWLEGLGEKEFLEMYSQRGWTGRMPEYAKEKVADRLDGIILREVEKFEGVPTVFALEKAIGVSDNTISRRIEVNPAINEKMEERGKKWLDGLGEKEFLEMYSQKGWVSNLPEYAKEKVAERFDGIILKEIGKFEGVTTAKELERAIGIGDSAIFARIRANEKLWMAFYLKRGLTPDQAVELALERNDESKAFEKALNERLRNLSAYREMIGLLRCFFDLMQKTVSCVSLYPEPLQKAAEELGVALSLNNVQMKPFRKSEAVDIPGCDTLIVHGLHRLPEEGLNLLFEKMRELYEENPALSIIATHSMDYSASEGFLSALENNGFRLDESGVVKIAPPKKEILEEYGVPFDDLSRVGRKISGEFNVLVFGMEKVIGMERIPCLDKVPTGDGRPLVLPEAEAVDVPAGMGRELKVKLFPSSFVVASSPFMVEVMEEGRKCALIGFDMDPERKNSVEVAVERGAPSEDYRKIARKLATDVVYRRKAGVVPNNEKKAELSKLKRDGAAA